MLNAGWGGTDDLTTQCPAAIDCALAALIKGEPATLGWSLGVGIYYEERRIHLVGDGTAFLQHMYEADLSCEVHDTERRVLKPRAFFEACATEASVIDRFEYVRSPFLEVAALETCSGGRSCGFL